MNELLKGWGKITFRLYQSLGATGLSVQNVSDWDTRGWAAVRTGDEEGGEPGLRRVSGHRVSIEVCRGFNRPEQIASQSGMLVQTGLGGHSAQKDPSPGRQTRHLPEDPAGSLLSSLGARGIRNSAKTLYRSGGHHALWPPRHQSPKNRVTREGGKGKAILIEMDPFFQE